MTDKSLTATVRDADMRVLATLTLGSAHENFWSGRCTCEGKPVFAVIENGEHDFENGVMNGVRFSRSYIMIGEVVHLIDIANSGWRVLIGSSIGAGPVPKPEMVQLLDSRTHECIEKINDNAGALFSRIIEANEKALRAGKDLELLGRSINKQVASAMDAASKANKTASALDERMRSAQADIEEILTDLGIARICVDGINDIIGKVVHLKSDKTRTMTASGLSSDGEEVLCIWFDDVGLRQEGIPMAALEVLSND
jgi:uncharacterized protein YodC (DUF2158 family)